MKKTIFTIFSISLISLLCVGFCMAQGTHKPVTLGSTASPYGYYEYLPQSFQQGGEKFPLLIFLHGAGEKGDGKTQLDRAVKFGPGREINMGKHLPFVVLSPQTSGWWNAESLDAFITQAIQKYNIDPNRVYLTGLSMGAMGIYQYAAKYAHRIAGIVGIAGSGRTDEVCKYSTVPLWAFHGDRDPVVPMTGSINIVNTYNNCSPKPAVAAKFTVLKGYAHWGWNEVYNGNNGDIYGWLLRHTKNGAVVPEPQPVPNVAPQANAGNDQMITLPLNAKILNGSGIDKDGKIVSYSWAKVYGPQVEMAGNNTAALSLKNMVAGTYAFRLTVKDDDGAADSDEVQVKVNAAPEEEVEQENPDISVIANAGSDRRLTLPVAKESLHGSAQWVNCSVQSYSWAKVQGPAVSMSGTGTANLSLSNLQEGRYVFRFTAKSNSGVSGSDDVVVEVLQGEGAEDPVVVPPVAEDNEVEPVRTQGLTYSYYKIDPRNAWSKLPDLKGINPVKRGQVDGFSLRPRDQNDYFAFSYDGYIKINTSGRYAFYTVSDEGTKLYIDDQLVVNNDGLHQATVKYGWVSLSSGYHKIRVEYFENTGSERLYVSYKGPGVALQAIPKSVLSTEAPALASEEGLAENGLNYAYYENKDVASRWYRLPDFSRLNAVKTGVVANFSLSEKQTFNHFAFLFEGRVKIATAGDYTFYTNSDDGSRLYIDGKLVVENDGHHAPQERAGRINLTAGYHDIKVVYYEHDGWEVLNVKWSGPGIAKQLMPAKALYQKAGGLQLANQLAENGKIEKGGLSMIGEESAEFRLYPNPARSEVNLDMGNQMEEEELFISISDLSGRNLYKSNYAAAGKASVRLDLDAIGLEKGAYMMIIENSRQEILKTVRFLKE